MPKGDGENASAQRADTMREHFAPGEINRDDRCDSDQRRYDTRGKNRVAEYPCAEREQIHEHAFTPIVRGEEYGEVSVLNAQRVERVVRLVAIKTGRQIADGGQPQRRADHDNENQGECVLDKRAR